MALFLRRIEARSRMIAAVTAIAKNYLPFARVLAESLRRWHPELPLFVALADEPEGKFAPENEPFSILRMAGLGIPALPHFCFRYNRREAISAIKPFAIGTVLERGFSGVLYLDADILALGDLSPLLDRVARQPLTLTPHTISLETPLQSELNILLCGVFNGGVMGVSAAPEAARFLQWWQQRTAGHCRYAVADGVHFDQRWLDFAPSFVPGTAVERDPAYNVAYWNLQERSDPGRWRLFHFSGFDPEQPDRLSRYWPVRRVEEAASAVALFRDYAERVMAAGFAETRDWPYAYDRFDNGEIIPDAVRIAYGRLGGAAAYFADPFGPAMRQWAAECAGDTDAVSSEEWRRAAQERLTKLREANVLLGEHQTELNRLRNELTIERQRTEWLTKQSAMFETAAAERLALLEKSAKSG